MQIVPGRTHYSHCMGTAEAGAEAWRTTCKQFLECQAHPGTLQRGRKRL